MTDTAPAPLPPDTPITIDNFAQALAQVMADLPTTLPDPSGGLWSNAGQLTLDRAS